MNVVLAKERPREKRATYPALRLQKPTLQIASAMTFSSVFITFSTLNVPPNAARSLVTAASVTSSFVCEESISETKVAKRRFYH
jgi:hypothetical protein